MYVCMYVCMYVSLLVCMYVCNYVCTHVCMCVCLVLRMYVWFFIRSSTVLVLRDFGFRVTYQAHTKFQPMEYFAIVISSFATQSQLKICLIVILVVLRMFIVILFFVKLNETAV